MLISVIPDFRPEADPSFGGDLESIFSGSRVKHGMTSYSKLDDE